jgi:hypothetical protein
MLLNFRDCTLKRTDCGAIELFEYIFESKDLSCFSYAWLYYVAYLMVTNRYFLSYTFLITFHLPIDAVSWFDNHLITFWNHWSEFDGLTFDFFNKIIVKYISVRTLVGLFDQRCIKRVKI